MGSVSGAIRAAVVKLGAKCKNLTHARRVQVGCSNIKLIWLKLFVVLDLHSVPQTDLFVKH